MATPNPDVNELLERDAGLYAATLFTTLAAEYLAATRSREGPVSTSLTSSEIAERFDEPMPRDGMPLESVAARLRDEVIPDCNRLYHPRYAGHQVSPPLPAAIWTEPLIAALNQSLAVAEMSPTGTVLEHRVDPLDVRARRLRRRLRAARSPAAAPRRRSPRCSPRAPACFPTCGRMASARIRRWSSAASTRTTPSRAPSAELGLGMRNVVVIPSRNWRMDTDVLAPRSDSSRDQGRRVMAVVATAGSTATGSFDDLETIGAAVSTSAASGSTWTARTARRRCSAIDIANACAASTARAPSRGIRTR